MKAIIVDDEPKAIELIKSYLIHFESIELEGTFRNALKALEFLNKENIELIFLDINMPHLSGISLSKMINPSTKVIFTTAYSEYAVESYEVDAIDYLLKPVSLERFSKAMSKVLNKTAIPKNEREKVVTLKSGAKTHFVKPVDILYLEKEANYMIYYLVNEKIITRESIRTALKNLPDCFIQVHKSFVVNLNKIDFHDRNDISVRETLIPIGQTYKNNFLKMFKI